MKLFISYSRRNIDVVRSVVTNLEQAGHDVWFDRELLGGQDWWDALLQQIRSCEVFVVAVSPTQLASKACGAEFAYATALGLRILPILIRDTNLDLAPSSLSGKHIVDYRTPTADSGIALVRALSEIGPATPLPDPLPTPPPAPVSDIGPLRDAVALPELSFAEQSKLIAEFEARRHENDQHPTLRALLDQFRQRPDVAASVARSISTLLAELPDEDTPDDTIAKRRPRRPLKDRDPDTVDRLRSLVTYVKAGQFTPIVGHGVNDEIIGSTAMVAHEWAKHHQFPKTKQRPDALADVAQFIGVMINTAPMRASLGDHLTSVLRARYPEVEAAGTETTLAEKMAIAWRAGRTPDDPYLVLAELRSPIYINANPWNLLTDAIVEAGRTPETVVCRWREGVYEWPPSVFDTEPDYVPTPERPLVFHVFGSLAVPDALVITQDDFDDFQIAIAEDRSLIPKPVQRVLANSAIMLLGFELDERDVRVLVRSLLVQEGAHNLGNYTHVAAQVEPDADPLSKERARKYVERYFSKFHQPSIDIFWGTEAEFAGDLAELWRAAR